MSLLSLFAFAVFAAETIVSPIPDNLPPVTQPAPKPAVSFGQLVFVAPTEVLGEQIEVTPTPAPAPVTRKKSYTIALLGDSMIDTLGPNVPHLKSKLTSLYGATTFTIRNFGVGGTNIDYGIERIASDYDYLGHHVSSVKASNPDIVVLESFGYNPFPDANGTDRHWLALARAVDSIRANIPGARIVIASTIAPNSKTFGDGAPGISFAPEDKVQRTTVIKQYLDSTVKFARSQHLPLADVYHASLDGNGDGILSYINGGDHIHYSDAGRGLFAQMVAGAIQNNHLLE